nr:uncharacterized protein CI109_005093 [Kwoniella shandongensis]KAA5526521.1 hypothetical protein CI109_005093 [Kwoniella shandongensis]
MFVTLTIPTLICLSQVLLAKASEALYTLEDTEATFYYDLTAGDRCAGRGQSSNTGGSATPNCEWNGPTYGEINTNRIVAMNMSLIQADRSAWCGKEVKIFQNDKEVVYDEPLVLWDVCEAAKSKHIVDLSVDTYVKLMEGGQCDSNNGNNLTGLRVQIMDNQIWQPAPNSDTYSPLPATKLYSGGGLNWNQPQATDYPPWKDGQITIGSGSGAGAGAVATSSALAGAGVTNVVGAASVVPTPAPAAAPASTLPLTAASAGMSASSGADAGQCTTKGEYQCQGTGLYMCNYVSNSADGLAWSLVTDCPGGCDAAGQTKCKQIKKREA